MRLSIIIPVFNEEKTVGKIITELQKVKLKKWILEVIVVDDGSTDKTRSILKALQKQKQSFPMYVISHTINEGKGKAVRSGIAKATGQYILIQDADMEYHPSFIPVLLKPVIEKVSEVVYGTRLKRMPNFTQDERTLLFFIHYTGNKFLSLLTSMLYGQWITDMETGYKVFPKKAVDTMQLRSKGFEFEPEITAKLMKKGYKIHEVAIKTKPRGYAEGKKIHTIKDGIKALVSLVKYRFAT